MNLTKEWIKAANLDIIASKKLLDEDNLTTIISFHCEQAIEKLFKALLVENGEKIPKIHDIRRLHKLLENQIKLTDNELDTLLILNDLYIESRYPGDMGLLPSGKPSLDDANEFYNFAVSIFDKICAIVGIKKEEF